MRSKIEDKEVKKCIWFLKEHDAWSKYIEEYNERPNNYNTRDIVADMQNAIRNAYDKSPFHYRTRGFNRQHSKYGESFWENINTKYLKFLKNEKL